MVVRFGLLTRKPGMSPAEFSRHWHQSHGPMAATFPGLRGYTQNVVVDARQLAIDHARGGWSLDGLSQLWFDDLDAVHAAISSAGYAPALKDETDFIGAIKLVNCITNVVVPLLKTDGPLIKRMSLLTRRPDIDAERFKHEWWGFHAEAVKKFPGLVGYNQNLVVERGRLPSDGATYADVPVDGVVEMWFRTIADLEGAFASPAAVVSQTHAKDFISEITTFLVEPRRVV